MPGGLILVKQDATSAENAPAGKVRVIVDTNGRIALKDEAGTVFTPQALIASLEALVATKQDASTAATDTELASEKTAREAADATLTAAAAAAKAVADAALPKAGGTMTGDIVLKGDPTANLHPATKQYVEAQIAAVIAGAPGALDTLKEISDQLANDENAVAALTTTVAGKLSKASNLSDVANTVTARTNLGLGTAATKDSGAAGEAGKVLASDDPAAFGGILKSHGEAEGKQAPNLSQGYVHTYTAKGAFTLQAPTNAPAGERLLQITVIVKQDAIGGRTIATENITWISGEPVFNTAANANNVIPLASWDGGVSWYGFGPEKGEKGATGATGAEGFYPGRLLLPSTVKTWKKPSANETENRAAKAASHPDRTLPSATLILTSGTPVVAAIPTPAHTVINGVGFALNALENTPANRTHLWVAVCNSAGKVLATGKDYTSATNVALTAAKLNALLLEEAIESGAEAEVLYAVLCEVMSSTNPITVYMRESNTAIAGALPMMAATAGAATTPPAVNSTLVLTEAAKEPYLFFV